MELVEDGLICGAGVLLGWVGGAAVSLAPLPNLGTTRLRRPLPPVPKLSPAPAAKTTGARLAVSGFFFRFSGLELSRTLIASAPLPRSEPDFGDFGFRSDFVAVAVLVVVGCAGAGSGEGGDEGGKIADFAA